MLRIFSEFLVIMPDTDKDTAFKLAEKIRLVIHETTFEPQDPLSVTISVGVSDRLENEAFASCFKRADDALYAAKAQGRNTVVMAKEELVE
jgi:diguanylate cyclase (GGDEF)-like protein